MRVPKLDKALLVKAEWEGECHAAEFENLPAADDGGEAEYANVKMDMVAGSGIKITEKATSVPAPNRLCGGLPLIEDMAAALGTGFRTGWIPAEVTAGIQRGGDRRCPKIRAGDGLQIAPGERRRA